MKRFRVVIEGEVSEDLSSAPIDRVAQAVMVTSIGDITVVSKTVTILASRKKTSAKSALPSEG